ncbi:hypothetical protein ACFSQ3_07390 [Sphingobacterium corticis]|uniref:DoxX family membrane protein n=1 Tax=Sphingobacterium corticis TaxID=1812823 RepID=A0ABW5NKK0_9SPHI
MRIKLGAFMLYAGIAHLTFKRKSFRAQVPPNLPISTDRVVVWSGYVEILLGLLVLFRGHRDPRVGKALAAFFVAVFPGNIAQYIYRRDAFGLNSDQARFARLFFQPILIALSLWSMHATKHKELV